MQTSNFQNTSTKLGIVKAVTKAVSRRDGDHYKLYIDGYLSDSVKNLACVEGFTLQQSDLRESMTAYYYLINHGTFH